MKKITLSLLFGVLFFVAAHAQNEVKYYIENDGKLTPTTQELFDKEIDYKKNIDVYFEKGNEKIGVLYKRKQQGKLSTEDTAAIIHFLENGSGKKVDTNKPVIINYITSTIPLKPEDIQSKWQILQRLYKKESRKRVGSNLFFTYNKNQKHTPEYYKRSYIDWIADNDDLLLPKLFKFEGNYGNVAIIMPDGSYMVHYGEYENETPFYMISLLKK